MAFGGDATGAADGAAPGTDASDASDGTRSDADGASTEDGAGSGLDASDSSTASDASDASDAALDAGTDAALPVWTPVLPSLTGGTPSRVTVSPTNPDVAWVGTANGGIYKTTNGTQPNATWTFVGAPGQTIGTILVDPSTPTTLYASSPYSVFLSTDSGQTWSALPGLATNAVDTISAIALGATSPTTLWVTTSYHVYETANAGGTWTPVAVQTFDAGGPNVQWGPIAIAPSNPAVVYVGVYGASGSFVSASTNGGATWSALPPFVPSAAQQPTVWTLAIDPGDPSTVWAGFFYPGAGVGDILVSSGGGAWTTPAGIPANKQTVSSIALAPSGQTSWATVGSTGIFTSTNAGATWTETTGTPTGSQYVGVSPSNTSIAYVTPVMDRVELDDAGATWTSIFSGIRAYDGYSVVVGRNDPNVVYVSASYVGIFRSSDGAQTWTSVPSPSNADVYLGLSSTNADVLYEGASTLSVSPGDGGPPAIVQASVDVTGLAVAPNDDRTVYASVRSGANGGVYFTTNGGATWTNPALSSKTEYGVAVDPTDASVAYTGSLKTIDHGATWSSAAASSFTQMAIDPTNSQNLYFVNGKVMKSTNGGGTATTLSGAPSQATSIAMDPNVPTTLYVGATNQGVWRSADSGQTWEPFGLSGWTPLSIAVTSGKPSSVIAGVEGGGFYTVTP
jgi:hypothetical protein